MKYSLEKKLEALEELKEFQGYTVYATVTKVARSGMSRRIAFYVPSGESILRISYSISVILDLPCDSEGILVRGCGMDMIFNTLYQLNRACARLDGFNDNFAPDFYREKDYLFSTDYRSL